MSAALSFRSAVLPWSVAADDERRYRKIVQRVLVLCLLFGILLPWLPVMTPDRTQRQEIPPPVAKLMLERELTKPAPPPVARIEQPVAPPAQVPLTAPERAAEKPASKRPETTTLDLPRARAPEARNPQPNKPPGEELDGVRRRAAGVGLLAMKSELAELRGAPVAVQMNQDIKPGRGVGAGQGVGVGAGTEQGLPARSLITSNATGGSGGINTAGYSRDTGGGGLAGRATTLVEGVAGGGGGGGAGGGGTSLARGPGGGSGVGGGPGGTGRGGTLQKGGSGKASRSIEEIRLVFERNKGAIYAIYNRALRDEPGLQGKVVLELKIAPDGHIVDLRIVSSELRASELESKLLARIRQFDFGAKDVDQMVVTYPVDFLPS